MEPLDIYVKDLLMSSDDIVETSLLSVRNVTKAYKVWSSPLDRFWALFIEAFMSIFKNLPISARIRCKYNSMFQTVNALRETSLEIKKGASIGIIGKNGAGKSTLLQIITGSLTPTSGTVKRRAKIAALLELGSGFDDDNTGIENAKINAALLGLNEQDIEKKLPSIINYAEIGEFINQPVRTYSTGMKMRLAFAVAAHVDAEIIIIDEALGVGDAKFQLKCAKTIENHIREGRALLFVSHSLNTVKQLCDRAILLNEGELIMEGDPNDVANMYSRLIAGDPIDEIKEHITRSADNNYSKNKNTESSDATNSTNETIKSNNFLDDDCDINSLRQRFAILSDPSNAIKINKLLNESELTKIDNEKEFIYGGEKGKISDIRIIDQDDKERTVFQTGESFTVKFKVEAYERILEPVYAVTFKGTNGQELYVCNSLYRGLNVPPLERGAKSEVSFKQKMNLLQGEYFLSFGFVTFFEDSFAVVHRRYDSIKIQVLPFDKCHGIVNMDTIITIEQIEE